MKNKILLLLVLCSMLLNAQVGINTTSPDASSVLDVVSTDKGILIPRMVTSQRIGINTPAKGLLVFDNTTNSFWYYNGINWVELSNSVSNLHDVDVDTKIQVEENTDEDKIRFDTNGAQRMIIDNVGNVGIGTGSPNSTAKIHINATGNASGILVTGSYPSSSGSVPNLGSGSRMMFYPTKSAFRAGYAYGSGWDNSKVGRYSVAMGWGPEATEYGTVALGNWAKANGYKSTAIGDIAVSEGDYSLAMGRHNTAFSFSECVVGVRSDYYTPNDKTAWHADDRIFTIGNGDSSVGSGRSNAMVVLKKGYVGLGTSIPVNVLDVEGGVAIGSSYSGSATAPTNGLIVEGNIGIGTSSTINKLDVAGGIAIGATYSGSATAPTNGAIIEGKLGIGTTSPSNQLHIGITGGIQLTNSETSNVTVTNGTIFYDNNYYSADEGGNGHFVNDGGGLALYNSDHSAWGALVDTNNMPYLNMDVNSLHVGGTSNPGNNNLVVDGNVGIGDTSPTEAKLVVRGYQTWNNFWARYYNSSGNNGSYSGNRTLSAYFSDHIATSELQVFSDKRIKSIIGKSDSSNDLNILMEIDITNYTMIDSIKDDKKYKKVIAQQVANVYPQAVSKNLTDVVPDIYTMASIDNKGWIHIATNLKKGERVRIISKDDTKIYKVLQVKKGQFLIDLKNTETKQVFVYGREVNDFHTVDYEAISMLNVSATQEQQKIIVALQKQNKALKETVEEQTKLSQIIIKQLNDIKATLNE
ncbi:MAG: hypothetical protein COA88_03100 [Kordia sp.]|nr:MAG: hypothetical protein COA88_03100 [Kordia sp.]